MAYQRVLLNDPGAGYHSQFHFPLDSVRKHVCPRCKLPIQNKAWVVDHLATGLNVFYHRTCVTPDYVGKEKWQTYCQKGHL